MKTRLALAVVACLAAGGASAQSLGDGNTTSSSSSSSNVQASTTMKDLLAQGYEIKSAVPNGQKFVIFMQKEQSAYACEFVSLTSSKCGAIN